ncbi:MAG TPA: VOC family protein [Gemmatimonadaceae bacterium]|jgi:glyoxalase family protein
MDFRLNGMHHVSSVSAHIGRTRDFYTRVLGLRPVITTVNQDDTSMYHLFFADGKGSPGSDMTVFDLPHAAPEHRGTNAISTTTFRVNGEKSLGDWDERFTALGVPHGEIYLRDGRAVLDFDDAVGTQLSLIDDRGVGESFSWADSSVPAEQQIRGLGYVSITVPDFGPTDRFLREAIGAEEHRTYPVADAPQHTVHVYHIGDAEHHVLVRDDLPRARYGSGGVHHLALRIPVDVPIEDWARRITSLGYRNSGVVDRHYFMSLYAREPNHILYELATMGPGFEVDGPIDPTRVSLPPFLEPRRAEIEEKLRPITMDGD